MDPGSAQVPEATITEAYEKANGREWAQAIALCTRALGELDPTTDLFRYARITELQAKCCFKQSLHEKTRMSFKLKIQNAIGKFQESAILYEKTGSSAFSDRSKARELYGMFWLTENVEEKKEILERCILLSNSSLETLETDGDREGFAETCHDLLIYYANAIRLDTDGSLINQHFEKAINFGRKAIERFEDANRKMDLLKSLHHTIRVIATESPSSANQSRAEELTMEAAKLQERLAKLSEDTGSTYAICLAREEAGNVAFNLKGEFARALELFQETAQRAESVYDSLEMGTLLLEIASVSEWLAVGQEHSERRRELLEKGLAYLSEATKALEVPLHTSELALTYAKKATCYNDLAVYVETEVEKKRTALTNAVEAALHGATYESGTLAWQLNAHELSKATFFLATLSKDIGERIRLLRESLRVRQETLNITDQLIPDFYWSRGVVRSYMALLKAELARVEKDPKAKIHLLLESGSHLRECLDLCGKSATNPGFKQPLAQYFEWYGDILSHVLGLTSDAETAQKTVTAYRQSIEYFADLGHNAPLGGLNWKIAKTCDSVGDFEGASQAFVDAAVRYRAAAQKIPGSAFIFEELASYTQAWAEIENARIQHAEEQYDQAHETYARAAKLLQATKSWNRLSMLLNARSLLEKGEALSRDEKHASAIESLTTALDGFRQAREEFEEMGKVAIDEFARREIEDWTMIAERREAYASGRIELEEARSLDRRGEKVVSSRKYKSASVTFRTLATRIPEAQDRAEMENLAQFCESWAKRSEAESKSSPQLFAEAAESFMRARETAANPGLRLLAMGDASICRALEAGTRFRQSRDVQLYSEIKRHLEVASDHYSEAGFKKTGTWTRATQRLFDALMLLAGAEVEREVGKKTELYHVAEQHLVLAAKLYGEAGFPSRKRETLEQLERTREEKEVLLAPLEALAEIPTASATHLPSITLRGAQPLGLERFEDAKVTGELRTPQTHLTTGSDFTVNIDIANVGKTPATLIKLEGIVPEGCDPVEKQSTPNLEGNSLDLKGKRLEYLKTHGVQVSFRPTRKGEFELSPRVVYVDEKGNYKSTNLQPLYLTVREPSIPEGLHAPPSVHLPQDFQFENERSRQVFSRLVKEFLDDYMTKRIVMERAGWRSLMDVIRDVKIPRSALYGPGGRTGPVLAELERRGLVETRVFPKERGRGGEIKKVRVAYENTIVRRIVDRAVMENA